MDVASTLFEERVDFFSQGLQFVKKIPWKMMKCRRPRPAKQARTKPVDDTPLYLLFEIKLFRTTSATLFATIVLPFQDRC